MGSPQPGDVADTRYGKIALDAVEGSWVTYHFVSDPDRKYRIDREYAGKSFKFRRKDRTDEVPRAPDRTADRGLPGPKAPPGPSVIGDPCTVGAIDALRFGLVPGEHLRDLSMFTDRLENFYRGSLPCDGDRIHPRANLVQGAYGEGKSHALAYVTERALEENYVVSTVEVDGKTVTPSRPETLLYSIFSDLRGNGLSRSTPLVDLYVKAIEKGYDGPPVKSFDRNRSGENYELVKAVHSLGMVEEVDDLLEGVLAYGREATVVQARKGLRERLGSNGGPFRPAPLMGREADKKRGDFIAALASASLIARAAGYRGMIVTFDEWEVMSFALAYWEKDKVRALLEEAGDFLVRGQKGKAPLALYIFNVPQAYQPRGGLAEAVDALVKGTKGVRFSVPALKKWDAGEPEIKKLVRATHSLYRSGYRCGKELTDKELMERIGRRIGGDFGSESGLARKLTKLIVAVLDQEYGPPYA